jgi:hypothetical protein
MSKIRRIGLTPDPPGGWPLDHILVGVATLRTIREMYGRPAPLRPWDLSLRTGVTPQGSAYALRRLCKLGLVAEYMPREAGEAFRFGLDRDHFLFESLGWLFRAERDEVKRLARATSLATRGLSAPDPERGGSATRA